MLFPKSTPTVFQPPSQKRLLKFGWVCRGSTLPFLKMNFKKTNRFRILMWGWGAWLQLKELVIFPVEFFSLTASWTKREL